MGMTTASERMASRRRSNCRSCFARARTRCCSTTPCSRDTKQTLKRERNGTIRLFWASELGFAQSDPGQDPRALGPLEPFWNMFDLTPAGRPDFHEQLQYEGCCSGTKAKALKELKPM